MEVSSAVRAAMTIWMMALMVSFFIEIRDPLNPPEKGDLLLRDFVKG